MIPASAGLITALSGNHDHGVALQVGSLAVAEWPVAITIGSTSHSPAPVLVEQLTAMQDATLATLTVLVADKGSVISAAHAADTLIGSAVVLTLIVKAWGSTTVYTLELFRGEVAQLVDMVAGLQARLRCTGDGSTFGRMAPDLFSDRCPYTTVAECPAVVGCARNWAACAANGQTDRFGGSRFVRPGGIIVEFRESSTALGTSGGTTSTPKVTVTLPG